MNQTSAGNSTNQVMVRWARIGTFVLIGGFAVFFYIEYAIRYFDWSAESYGPYYWGKRVPLGFHLLGSSLALALGLPQFWMGFRNRFMNVHRWTGRLYVLGVLIGSIGAFLMSTTPEQSLGFGFAFSLFALAVAWVTTTGAAFFAIIRRKIKLHKEWMIRSYIVTLAFVTFRLLSDYVPYDSWGLDHADYNTAMMWSCWVFPLMISEVILQFRKL
jgi:uncharacterized membrane protein YozB (DUF420 family)